MTTGAPPTRYATSLAIRDMIAVVDERAKQCNRRWGINRLPNLIPIEWMERFWRQKRKWELACFETCGIPTSEDLDRIREHGNAMLRAFDKLEEIARAAGHREGPPEQWEFELGDGSTVVLVRDMAETAQVETYGRKVQVWSLEEIVNVIEHHPILAAAKEEFPGMEMLPIRTNRAGRDALDDSLADLPF